MGLMPLAVMMRYAGSYEVWLQLCSVDMSGDDSDGYHYNQHQMPGQAEFVICNHTVRAIALPIHGPITEKTR